MARSIGMNETAELSLSMGSSSAGVKMFIASELSLACGVSLGSVDMTGPAEASLLVGPQMDASYVAPSLIQWRITGIDGVTFSTMTVEPETTTGGDPCTVQFKLVLGRDQEVFTTSAPEQNSPHAATCIVDNPDMRGQLCDLWWRWFSGEHFSAYELVAAGAVQVPGTGDSPTDNGGS